VGSFVVHARISKLWLAPMFEHHQRDHIAAGVKVFGGVDLPFEAA
jgi:hypothetical protein